MAIGSPMIRVLFINPDPARLSTILSIVSVMEDLISIILGTDGSHTDAKPLGLKKTLIEFNLGVSGFQGLICLGDSLQV